MLLKVTFEAAAVLPEINDDFAFVFLVFSKIAFTSAIDLLLLITSFLSIVYYWELFSISIDSCSSCSSSFIKKTLIDEALISKRIVVQKMI